MKQILKRVATAILFLAFIFWLITEGGRLLHPTETGNVASFGFWDYFYAEDKNTIDVAMIGSSSIYRYFSPLDAYEDYGFTTFMLTSSSQEVGAAPYILEEVNKYQDVDLYVVALRDILRNSARDYVGKEMDEKVQNYYLSNVASAMKFSPTKYKMVKELMEEDDENSAFEWMFPMLKYHDTIMEISPKTLLKRVKKNKSSLKMTALVGKHKAYTIPEYQEDHSIKISDSQKKSIDQIVEAANACGKKVLFVTSPSILTQTEYAISLDLQDYMQEKGYDYLDMNQYMDEMGMDPARDFYNKNHVNLWGAEKYTKYLSEYMLSHYDITPAKLNKKQKQEWKDALTKWAEKKQKLQIKLEEMIATK